MQALKSTVSRLHRLDSHRLCLADRDAQDVQVEEDDFESAPQEENVIVSQPGTGLALSPPQQENVRRQDPEPQPGPSGTSARRERWVTRRRGSSGASGAPEADNAAGDDSERKKKEGERKKRREAYKQRRTSPRYETILCHEYEEDNSVVGYWIIFLDSENTRKIWQLLQKANQQKKIPEGLIKIRVRYDGATSNGNPCDILLGFTQIPCLGEHQEENRAQIEEIGADLLQLMQYQSQKCCASFPPYINYKHQLSQERPYYVAYD